MEKHTSSDRLFFLTGSLSAGLGVAAGAFGAHGLKTVLSPDMLGVYETAVRYQMYHAFALMITAWVASRKPSSGVTAAGWCFIAGTILFSGSLYVLTLSGVSWLGAITPLGGVSFIGGWIFLALAYTRQT